MAYPLVRRYLENSDSDAVEYAISGPIGMASDQAGGEYNARENALYFYDNTSGALIVVLYDFVVED